MRVQDDLRKKTKATVTEDEEDMGSSDEQCADGLPREADLGGRVDTRRQGLDAAD